MDFSVLSSLPCSLVENPGARDASAVQNPAATGMSWQTATGNKDSGALWLLQAEEQLGDGWWHRKEED